MVERKADPGDAGGAGDEPRSVDDAARLREIKTLTALLRNEEAKNARLRDSIAWLIAVRDALARAPWWWSLLKRPARHQREIALLERAGLFDSAAYLKIHPDVAASGIPAFDHYWRHGLLEGRSRAHR